MEEWPSSSKATVSPMVVNRVVMGVLMEAGTKRSSHTGRDLISSNRRTLKVLQVTGLRQFRIHLRKCKCLQHTVNSRFLLLSTATGSYQHQPCLSGSQQLQQTVKSITTTNAPELRSGRSQQVCCKELACIVLSSEHCHGVVML